MCAKWQWHIVHRWTMHNARIIATTQLQAVYQFSNDWSRVNAYSQCHHMMQSCVIRSNDVLHRTPIIDIPMCTARLGNTRHHTATAATWHNAPWFHVVSRWCAYIGVVDDRSKSTSISGMQPLFASCLFVASPGSSWLILGGSRRLNEGAQQVNCLDRNHRMLRSFVKFHRFVHDTA